MMIPSTIYGHQNPMTCPYCGNLEQRVLDSRPARDGLAIRRRRECARCDRRFTTFEEPERPRLFVVKRDGTRQEFDREKILDGLRIACRKRPVSIESLKEIASRIEYDLFQEFEEEVGTGQVGERVLKALFDLDSVAWVRFASVYRDFKNVEEFQEIVESVSLVLKVTKPKDSAEKVCSVSPSELSTTEATMGSGRSS